MTSYAARVGVLPPKPLDLDAVLAGQPRPLPSVDLLAAHHLRSDSVEYRGIYGVDGFFDAVNPTTGAVGHRYLVLDQSMIMAALDNAPQNRALQRYFADDPVSWAAQTYLGLEKMIVYLPAARRRSGTARLTSAPVFDQGLEPAPRRPAGMGDLYRRRII